MDVESCSGRTGPAPCCGRRRWRRRRTGCGDGRVTAQTSRIAPVQAHAARTGAAPPILVATGHGARLAASRRASLRSGRDPRRRTERRLRGLGRSWTSRWRAAAPRDRRLLSVLLVGVGAGSFARVRRRRAPARAAGRGHRLVALPEGGGLSVRHVAGPPGLRHPVPGFGDLAVMEHPVAAEQGRHRLQSGRAGGERRPDPADSGLPHARRRCKDQFTFVSFDERGTGSSEPLLCGPSAAAAGSAIAGTAAATRTFAGLERSCRAELPPCSRR